MKRLAQWSLALTLAMLAVAASAAPAAVVEGVQAPAFVERNLPGSVQRSPLEVGMELKGGDTIRTGAGARVYVKLAEGTLLQLGENASLRLQEIQPGGVFRAAINVLEGAFRFTTDALFKGRKRDVSITIRTVTAGIRGTDVWGKSTEERQIVCLIEGKVEVGAAGESSVTMDRPLQFYQREQGRTAPVGLVDPAQLRLWAAETAIESGKGAARRGRFSVTLAEVDDQAAALGIYDRARDAGYAARIRPQVADGKTTYRIVLGNIASKAEADALAGSLKGRFDAPAR